LQRLGHGIVALCLFAGLPWAHADAQDLTVDEIKGKIFDARMAQQTFANGLRFCSELDGTNFYFAVRNRVIDLEDYHRGLEGLAKAQVYNPQTRRPWSKQDADQRWEEVKKEAARDKDNCSLVTSLPELEKRLETMQAGGTASQK
jgi:hypothetical protein